MADHEATTGTCVSCGTERPAEQLRQAYSLAWLPIPNAVVCVSRELCFAASDARWAAGKAERDRRTEASRRYWAVHPVGASPFEVMDAERRAAACVRCQMDDESASDYPDGLCEGCAAGAA